MALSHTHTHTYTRVRTHTGTDSFLSASTLLVTLEVSVSKTKLTLPSMTLLLLLLLFPLGLRPVLQLFFSPSRRRRHFLPSKVYFSSHGQPLGATTVFTANFKGGANACRAFIQDQKICRDSLELTTVLLCLMFSLKINPLREGRGRSSVIDETAHFLLFIVCFFPTCSVFVKDLVQLLNGK